MEKTIIDEMLQRANIVAYMPELLTIQARLKVPKDRRNDYGKYNYRSAADILEQAKPILEEVKCIILTPSITIEYPQCRKTRVYAILTNSRGETMYAVNEVLEETGARNGMSAAQMSGSSESYAKKYALGNLLALDDTADDDATNTHGADGREARGKRPRKASPTPQAEQQAEPQAEPQAAEQAAEPQAEQAAVSAPAIDPEVEYAIHGCATCAELTEMMNAHSDWLDDEAIRAMANKYYKELKGNA